MTGQGWKHEKIALFLRWILVVFVFAGLFFFISEKSDPYPGSGALLILGIVALLGTLFFQTAFSKIKLNQYHMLGWVFDYVVVFLLIAFTGGLSEKSEIMMSSANFFIFLLPLLVLDNSVGRPWYWGIGSAVMVNGGLAVLYFTAPEAAKIHWSFFAIMVVINFAIGALFLFQENEEYDESGEDSEKKKIRKMLEQSTDALRKEAEARKKSESELYDKTRKLTSLIHVSRSFGSSFTLSDLFETIVEKAREEMNSLIGFIMLEKEGRLEVVRGVGMSEITMQALNCQVKPGASPIADVMFELKSVRLNHKDNENLKTDYATATEKIKTLLVAPLIAPQEKRALGVLAVANLLVGDSYSADQEDYLNIFAVDAAMFIRQLKLKQDLEKSFFELIRGLAQAIEAKDAYTRGHVKRVSDYSRHLAIYLKLPQDEISRIEKAAILHDIGKIATPEKVLNKPGRLTDEEFEIMKQHVAKSREMLADLTLSIEPQVKDYVGYHHERWDGKGYPKGLKADQIPLGAQIIAIADTFDAMTSDRPYRKGFEPEEALKRLIETAGTQFNPELLHAFFDMVGFNKDTGSFNKNVRIS